MLINTIESKPLMSDGLWATLYIARDLIPFIPRGCYSYIGGFGEIGQCSDKRIRDAGDQVFSFPVSYSRGNRVS